MAFLFLTATALHFQFTASSKPGQLHAQLRDEEVHIGRKRVVRLMRECTAPMHFATHQEARTALFEYIEAYYNRVRKHSTLGYLSPVQFELAAHQ